MVADRACPRILIPKPPAEQRHAALANQDSREEGGVGTKTPTTSCPLHTDTQAHKTETNTTRQASLLLPWWQGGGRGKSAQTCSARVLLSNCPAAKRQCCCAVTKQPAATLPSRTSHKSMPPGTQLGTQRTHKIRYKEGRGRCF